ncbi:O-antigen ligase family protein [Paenibacillus camerounensis]|uniref:O-antigen ligase family protein n=1 Tax=Paenibacillus camerounensis TaxID=1243663 RepID=UPI0006939B2B|nr:O-antigen ligase family protein [Paenibacillus camerounensis]
MSAVKGKRRLQIIAVWGSAGMVTAAAAAACLLRGLFFAREMYGLMAVWFGLCTAAAAACLFVGWHQAAIPAFPAKSAMRKLPAKLRMPSSSFVLPAPGLNKRVCNAGSGMEGQPGKAGMTRGAGKAVIVAAGCLLLILALYAVQLREPLSVLGTLNELLRWGLYAGFACCAVVCAGSRRGTRFLEALWTMLGMTICLSGLLAVCGGLPVPFAVAYTASPAVSVAGARLGGLLQYPNAFGAAMAVFLLERVIAAAGERQAGASAQGRLRAPDTARQLLRMLPLFPYAAALLLSESRGAMLAAACAAAAALLLQRQLAAPLLICAAAPAAAAALLYRQLARTGLAAEPLPGLLLLAGCWAGALLAGLWLCRRSRRAAGRDPAAMLLAAGLWTAAGSAVLALLRGRISGPSPTAAARGLFYRDALRLAGEAPWLGQGGETWRSAYLAVQSRPYVGSQVHSGYLDFLLNLGIAGGAVLLLMLLAALYIAGRNAPGLLPPMLIILLHGAVDFSWSYGLFWLLLFLLTARALAGSPLHRPVSRAKDAGCNSDTADVLKPVSVPAVALVPAAKSVPGLTASATKLVLNTLSRRSSARQGQMTRSSSAQRSGVRELLIATVCFCLICTGISFKLWRGEVLFKQASGSAAPEEQSILLRKSLRYNPYAPRTAINLAVLLPEREKIELLHSSLRYSPGDAELHWLLAESYLNGNDPGRALYWMRRSLDLDRYNAVKWESAAKGLLQMGQHFLAKGDRSSAAAMAYAGHELTRGYRLLALSEHNKGQAHNDRGFAFSAEAEELGVKLDQLIAAAVRVRTVEANGQDSLELMRGSGYP